MSLSSILKSFKSSMENLGTATYDALHKEPEQKTI